MTRNDTLIAVRTRVNAIAWLTVDAIPQSWVQPRTYESETEFQEGANLPEILVSDDVASGEFWVGRRRDRRI